jgi:hypothetical protein
MSPAHTADFRTRIAGLAAVASLWAVVACAGALPSGPEAKGEPVVRRIVRDDVVGFAVTLRLGGSPRAVERWLLDFDRIAADRPNVLDARLVGRDAEGWLARFRFRGILGVNPTSLTRTTRRRVGDAVILEFRSVETSFGLDRIFGSYRIEPDGAGGCVLTHRLFVDSPFVTEEARERDLREDAEAIRRRFG